MAADMDGEMVMMSVSQGSYFAINEVGALIWSTLETPKTVSEITDAVKAFRKMSLISLRIWWKTN